MALKIVKRYCPQGHDKLAPHGTYISVESGAIYYKCAECRREKSRLNRNRWKRRRKGYFTVRKIKVSTPDGLRNRIDEKHHIDGIGDIVKTTNMQRIPDNEPRILFRGRDKLALPMLIFYRNLCEQDGCTDFQLQSIDVMIDEFREFAEGSTTMKQPGITKGK